jgi:S-adenosylmethionine:tRNA ribosyltransferase-isomerase
VFFAQFCRENTDFMTEKMIQPREIKMADYWYELPENRIAQYPLAERDASQLLIYKDGSIEKSFYRELAGHLPPQSLLIFNNTRVVPARLILHNHQGQAIEVFCLEPGPAYSDVSTALLQTGGVTWRCMVGGAKKWKEGELTTELQIANSIIQIKVAKESVDQGTFLLQLSWLPAHLPFAEVLSLAGQVPLPPYLNRDASEEDKERYQTIYALSPGSVAAPTAGLHFTPELMRSLEEKSIRSTFVTLHVGAGTFLPVKSETPGDHVMHKEYFEVSKTFLETLQQQLPDPIVTVGTTSMRTLESLYRLAVQIHRQPEHQPEKLHVEQWEAYEKDSHSLSPAEAIATLLRFMEQHQLEQLVATTQLLIAPGYVFKFTDGLITNFHQPGSTLLLLVGALVGDDWRKIYEYALQHDFRFLSYGDGSLLWKKK